MKKYSGFSLFKNALSYHENWQKVWRSPSPQKHYDVIIVGGGGHGLATAYYLAKVHGITNIAVIEKGYLGGGNTARNTTIIRSNYLWDEAAQLYDLSLKLWEGLSQELNYNVMFSQRGVLNLGHNLQDMRDIERRVNANRLNGIDGEVVSPQRIKEIAPLINISPDTRYPILGASWQPRGAMLAARMRWAWI
jgi:sarcosine oxidase subunit beta